MSLFTNKKSVSLIQGKALLYMKRRPSRMEKGVSLYQQNAFFAMKRCLHQMKRILKSRDRCLRLSLLMAPWTKVLYTIDTHLSLSVIALHQHYFPADDERIVRRRWGESWGEAEERVGKELLRRDGAMRVESYEVESYRVESGTNKKRASKISLQSSLK